MTHNLFWFDDSDVSAAGPDRPGHAGCLTELNLALNSHLWIRDFFIRTKSVVCRSWLRLGGSAAVPSGKMWSRGWWVGGWAYSCVVKTLGIAGRRWPTVHPPDTRPWPPIHPTPQTRDVELMMVCCRASVCDAGPTANQLWFNVSRLLRRPSDGCPTMVRRHAPPTAARRWSGDGPTWPGSDDQPFT